MAEAKVKKAWYKRWWAIVLFIIIGLMILVSLSGNNNTPSSSLNSNSQDQIKATPPQNQAAKVYNLGDEIQAGDFKWKITKSATAKAISLGGALLDEKLASTAYGGANADGVFLILDVEVENTGKTAQYLMDSFVKLVDDQSREFSPDSTAALYLKPVGSAILFEEINPGIIKKGKIVYDVPEGIKVANVKISSNLLGSSIYNVRLAI